MPDNIIGIDLDFKFDELELFRCSSLELRLEASPFELENLLCLSGLKRHAISNMDLRRMSGVISGILAAVGEISSLKIVNSRFVAERCINLSAPEVGHFCQEI